MPIQLLAPQLANQIAAGEVVERPASVVKELVENSIDAGASKIELDIEKGGHKRIKITDNGSGIEKDELTLALSRHATSKISTLDDLESILSLGFRGEALASISSVSRLTLTSKTASQEEAWQAHCEGRDMQVKLRPAAHPTGTTIDVVDLFYNTPARRKFLRTEKTEFQHIEEVIKRIGLSHPSISFVLSHNGKVVRRLLSRQDKSLETRIASIVGSKFIRQSTHTHVQYEGIELEAWLGDDKMLRSSTDHQFSFVNGRPMRDKLILHAVRQAYESVMGRNEQPSFVLYLTVPAREVDVNVHPAKHEVRFQQSRLVHDFIVKSVTDALRDSHSGFGESVTVDESVNHDYIRPLTTASSSGGPQFSGLTQAGLAPYSASGRRDSTPRGRVASVARDAVTNYQTLMTPSHEAAMVSGALSQSLQRLKLGESGIIMIEGEKCALLSRAHLSKKWLVSVLQNATTSQPLLMPVAVTCASPDERVINSWKALHIVVNKIAGKVRLQQVPAGTRHLPWSVWFGELLTHAPETSDALCEVLATSPQGWPQSALHSLWAWLEGIDNPTLWEWCCAEGKTMTTSELFARVAL